MEEGNQDNKIIFDYIGKIKNISGNIWYESCNTPSCKKKISEVDGKKYCAKCQKYVQKTNFRFIADIVVADITDEL